MTLNVTCYRVYVKRGYRLLGSECYRRSGDKGSPALLGVNLHGDVIGPGAKICATGKIVRGDPRGASAPRAENYDEAT